MSPNRAFFAAAAASALLGASPAVFAQATASATPASGATIPTSITYQYTYTVNAGAAADPGATPAPNNATFKTLARAISDAVARKNAGSNVVVNIVPGTYRESVSIPEPPGGSGDAAWLTIQRSGSTGAVVITGATTMLPDSSSWNSGWTSVSGSGSGAIWRHVWPYDYTLSPTPGNHSYPGYYDGGPNLADTVKNGPGVPLVRRKELIFVGTTLLRQVGSTFNSGSNPPAGMTDGSFHLNVNPVPRDSNNDLTNPPAAPPNKYVFINPPGSVNPNGANLEVAERSFGMRINQRRNIIVKNLEFTRATGYQIGSQDAYGLGINGNCENILVEDCRAYHNNNVGVRISGGAITLRRTDASDNGKMGIYGGTVRNIRVVDSITDRNNFRGDWADYISGAAPAGFKFQHVRDTTWIRHQANDNFARGMWWDSDCTNIYVESSFMSGNVWSGMFVEYVQGPTLVKRCIIRDTKIASGGERLQFVGGLLMSTCTDVTLQSNIVYNNAYWQMRIINTFRRGDAYDMDSTANPPASLQLSPRRFSFKNNVLLAQNASGFNQMALTFPPNEDGPNPNHPYSDIYVTMDSGVNQPTSGPNCVWNWNRDDLFGTTEDSISTDAFNITTDLSTYSLAAWRSYAGQEWASIQQTPGFANPGANDFTLAPLVGGQSNPLLQWDLPTAPLD